MMIYSEYWISIVCDNYRIIARLYVLNRGSQAMIQVDFSSEQIEFVYREKTHLTTRLTIKNSSGTIVYYKFKLTRPKFYLLKPDRGFIEAHQSVTVDITIHQEGVNEGESDKLKCFYRSVGHFKDEPAQDWEKDEIETYTIRLPIVINGLPEQFKRQGEGVKRSDVKSVAGSKFDASRASNSSTLESSIREKEAKVATLKNQIATLKSANSRSSKLVNSYWPVIAVGCASLIMGVVSSIWI